jgi:hypothetical protein
MDQGSLKQPLLSGSPEKPGVNALTLARASSVSRGAKLPGSPSRTPSPEPRRVGARIAFEAAPDGMPGIEDFEKLPELVQQLLAKESKWVSPQQLFTWVNTYLNVKNSIGIVLFIEMIIERCGARPEDGSVGQYALMAGEMIAALGIMLASNPYNTKPIQDAHAYYGSTLPHKAKKMARLRSDYWETSYLGHASIVISSLSFAVAQALLSKQATFYIPAASPMMYTMMAMIGASYVFPSTVRANHALTVLGFMCCNRRSPHNASLPTKRGPLVPLYLAATLISLPYSYPIGSAMLALGGLSQASLGVWGHFALANLMGHPFIIPQAGVTADELYKFVSKLSCDTPKTTPEASAYKGGFSYYNILALSISFFAMALTTFALAFKQFQSSGIGTVAAAMLSSIAALKFIAQARPMVKHLKREDGFRDLVIPPAKGTLDYEHRIIEKLLAQWKAAPDDGSSQSSAPSCCGLEKPKSLREKIQRRYKHFLAMIAVANIRELNKRGGCSQAQVREAEVAIHRALKDGKSSLGVFLAKIFEGPKENVIERIRGVLGCDQQSQRPQKASATVLWPAVMGAAARAPINDEVMPLLGPVLSGS